MFLPFPKPPRFDLQPHPFRGESADLPWGEHASTPIDPLACIGAGDSAREKFLADEMDLINVLKI